MKTSLDKRHSSVLVAILFFIAFAAFVETVSFTDTPAITPLVPATNDSLNCTWIPTDDSLTIIPANVTWYNGSAPYQYESSINCTNSSICITPRGIPGSVIRRGEFWNCTVIIGNASENVTRSVKVNISNANPRIQSLENVTVFEDVAYAQTVTAVDPDSDLITWFSNDNNFSSDLFVIGQDSGLISFTPAWQAIGNHTMDIIAIDGQGGSNAVRIVFWVKEVDDPPLFGTAISSQIINEGASFILFVNASDEENDTFNFSLTAPTLSSLGISWINNYSMNLTFATGDHAPAYTDVGNHTVTLAVYELKNSSVNTTAQFNLDIRSVNHAPLLAAISNQSGVQGSSFILDINATDQDPDNLTFTTSANCSLPNPWTVTASGSSNDARAFVNLTLNNTHVVCRWVTFIVSDGKVTTSQAVVMNITNTNDAPVIGNISTTASNTVGTDIRNLTGHYGLVFRYTVNATDPDQLTYAGDTLSYMTNDTLFPIDAATGMISFETNTSMVGNRSVNVTATDLSGANAIQELHADIRNNTIPVFTTNGTISCQEKVLCTMYISGYDPDPGENLTFASNDSVLFALSWYNTIAAQLSFTPNDDQLGNRSVLVNVTDNVGATATAAFILQINNTNDAPFFDMNRDNASDNISLPTIVETYQAILFINATDHDLKFGDNLSFSVRFVSGPRLDLFNVTTIGPFTALLNFTPNESDDGNYTANFSVTDLANASDYRIVTFIVYNRSYAPNITLITPYYNDTLNRTIEEFVNASPFSHEEQVNFSESTNLTYNATADDQDGNVGNLTFLWYTDGTLSATQYGINETGLATAYDYFSSGTHNITLVVRDAYYSTDTFTWIASVENVNRAPRIINGPVNLTGVRAVNTTVTLNDYFSYYASSQHFLDPDDDLNANSMIRDNVTDPGESFRLAVTGTNCSIATLTPSGASLTIIPLVVGTCLVTFTATDDGNLTVTSGTVRIDVNGVPSGAVSPTPVATTSVSGGGSSTTITKKIVIPQNKNVDVPKPVEIVVPGRVIMYENRTMRVPIIIKNTWNGTLSGISLEAETNNTGITMNFTKSFIRTLEQEAEETLFLNVGNYREAGPYAIIIRATVSKPPFVDTGVLYINSIEEASQGRQVEIKIAFAKDLLASNKECQELNELLDKAETAKQNNNYDQALNYVDSAVNGCKFLINQIEQQKQNERPSPVTIFKQTRGYLTYIIAGLLFLVLVFLIIFIIIKKQEIKLLKSLE